MSKILLFDCVFISHLWRRIISLKVTRRCSSPWSSLRRPLLMLTAQVCTITIWYAVYGITLFLKVDHLICQIDLFTSVASCMFLYLHIDIDFSTKTIKRLWLCYFLFKCVYKNLRLECQTCQLLKKKIRWTHLHDERDIYPNKFLKI